MSKIEQTQNQPLSEGPNEFKLVIAAVILMTTLFLFSRLESCKKKRNPEVIDPKRYKELVLDSILLHNQLLSYKRAIDSMKQVYEAQKKLDSMAIDSLSSLSADQQAKLLASKHGLHYQTRNNVSARQRSNIQNK